MADEDHVYLVDSGNDKDAGRKVRQILDKNGWRLTAILIPTPMQTTSAGTDTCRSRRDVKFIPAV